VLDNTSRINSLLISYDVAGSQVQEGGRVITTGDLPASFEVNSITLYDTGANVSVRNSLDGIKNIRSRNVSSSTPVGQFNQSVKVGDSSDDTFIDLIVLEESNKNIDCTKGLQEAGFIKSYSINGDYYEFYNPETMVRRIYQGQEDGLYYLIEKPIEIMSLVQVHRAKVIERFHRGSGHVNWRYLTKSITNNIYKNNLISKEDILWYAQQYKPGCLACMKGKTKFDPQNHSNNLHKINYDSEDFYTIFADIMYIEGIPYLLCKISRINWRNVFNLGDRHYTGKLVVSHLTNLIQYMNKRFEVCIKRLRFDSENKVVPYESQLNSIGVELCISPSGIHVPTIEKDIQLYKNKIRCIVFDLEYSLNAKYYDYLVFEVCYILNHTSNGKLLTPFELLYKLKPDIRKLTDGRFGELVICSKPYSDNTMKTRIDIGIMLGHKNNGTILIDKLNNQEVVNRYTIVQVIQITKDVVKYLNSYDSNSGIDITTINITDARTSSLVDIPSDSRILGGVKNGVLQKYRQQELDLLEENLATQRDLLAGISTGMTPSVDFNHSDDVMVLDLHAAQMTYQASCKLKLQETNAALANEFELLDKRKAIKSVSSIDIPDSYQKKLVNIMTRFVHKYKNGVFDRVKCRLLLLGNEIAKYYQDSPEELHAYTVSLTSILIVIGLIAKYRLKKAQIDFTGAFLYAALDDKDKVYSLLTKEQTQAYLKVTQKGYDNVLSDGRMIVHVEKALYGHPVSPKAWLDKISKDIISCGFIQLESDKCVFIGPNAASKLFILLYVDDIFIGYEDDNDLKILKNMCNDKYGEYTIDDSNDNDYTYLHMNLHFNDLDGSVRIDQEDYFKDIMDKNLVPREYTSNYPHPNDLKVNLFEEDGSKEDQNKMLSVVMSLYWACKRTRPDLLFNVSYLATRCKHATNNDWKLLKLLLGYINKTITDGIRLCFTGDVCASLFVDSSAQLYEDFRGHGGYVLTVGTSYGGPVEVKSGKSKSNCRSTMEFELVELHLSLPALLWTRMFLTQLGFDQNSPSYIFEDNQAVLDIMVRGQVSTGVSRYIESKFYYCRSLVKENIVRLIHCPTQIMIADIITKNLTGSLFEKIRSLLLNVNPVREVKEEVEMIYDQNSYVQNKIAVDNYVINMLCIYTCSDNIIENAF